MKNYFKPLMTAALTVLLMTSCSDDDENSQVNNNSNINAIINTASSGTWKITSFVESDNDHTSQFDDFNFTFGDNSVLTAANGSTYTGTWSVTDSDNSTDDSPEDNDIDFNIVFSDPSPLYFQNLNDDWDVVQVTATTISLIDVSGGNGGTDTLIFTKNN